MLDLCQSEVSLRTCAACCAFDLLGRADSETIDNRCSARDGRVFTAMGCKRMRAPVLQPRLWSVLGAGFVNASLRCQIGAAFAPSGLAQTGLCTGARALCTMMALEYASPGGLCIEVFSVLGSEKRAHVSQVQKRVNCRERVPMRSRHSSQAQAAKTAKLGALRVTIVCSTVTSIGVVLGEEPRERSVMR